MFGQIEKADASLLSFVLWNMPKCMQGDKKVDHKYDRHKKGGRNNKT